MRIRTTKLKAPSPIAVLLICLLWPLAAVVGATVNEAQCENAATLDSSSDIKSAEVKTETTINNEQRINTAQKAREWHPLTKFRALTLAGK